MALTTYDGIAMLLEAKLSPKTVAWLVLFGLYIQSYVLPFLRYA